MRVIVTIPAKRNGDEDRRVDCPARLLGRTYLVTLPWNDWLAIVGRPSEHRELAFSHPRSARPGRFNLTGGGSHYLQPYFDKEDITA